LTHFLENCSRAVAKDGREICATIGSERGVIMPGPRPIPTQLKLLRGNPGHQKLNKNEPQPPRTAEPPECPSFLASFALDEWHRVSRGLWLLGLLTELDVMPLSAYCIAYQHWREAEEALAHIAERDPQTRGLLIKTAEGNARINPLLRASASAAADMVRFASEFGFSPAARSRVASGIAYELAPGKFDGLIAQ
jgi:P27 family predicted phage terminase small subunit